jgi:hypothetical protein
MHPIIAAASTALALMIRVRRKNWNIVSYRHSPIIRIIRSCALQTEFPQIAATRFASFQAVCGGQPGVQIWHCIGRRSGWKRRSARLLQTQESRLKLPARSPQGPMKA